jgi:hypothetical protein
MAVTKLSISLDEDLADELRVQAEAEGVSTSAFVADAVQDRLRHLALLRAVLAYEHDHGAFTDDELSAALAALDGD